MKNLIIKMLSVALVVIAMFASLAVQAKEYPIITEEQKLALGISEKNIDLPIVIDFYANWCMPCLEFAPTFNKLKTKYRFKANLLTIDYDKNKTFASSFGIKALPSFLFVDCKGNVIDTYIGKPSEFDFDLKIQELINNSGLNSIEQDLNQETIYYNLQGQKLTSPQKGILIEQEGTNFRKKYIK